MSPRRNGVVPSLGTALWTLALGLTVTGCARPFEMDLLPAGSSGRVEAALEIPPDSRLELELELTETDRAAPSGPVRLEVWSHLSDAPALLLLCEEIPVAAGRHAATIDLGDLGVHVDPHIDQRCPQMIDLDPRAVTVSSRATLRALAWTTRDILRAPYSSTTTTTGCSTCSS